MKIQFKIFLTLFFIIGCLACGYVGYLINEYKHKEQEVKTKIADIKKVNETLPKKNDSTMSHLVKRQQATIDSLLKERKVTHQVNNIGGFTMDGKSISSEELLRYVNKLYKESNYYKNLYEILAKKYEIKSKENEDGTITVTTKDPQHEETINQFNSLQAKYNDLISEYNDLVKKFNITKQEKLNYQNEASNLKTALELIKDNYNIEYNIEKKNDSVNTISIDKARRKKKNK